jgi:hypothetical protein
MPIERKTCEQLGEVAKEDTMELHAPTKWLFGLSLAIAVLSIVASFTSREIISQQGFWGALLAYVVLLLANVVDTSWKDSGANQ